MTKPTIFYNGACPVCRREIEHYQDLDRRGEMALDWCDISQETDRLMSAGLTADQAKRRLHVQDANGTLKVGLPAFLSIWKELQRYRWLAKLAGLPGIRHGLALAYEPVAWMLYRLDRRRSRRSST